MTQAVKQGKAKPLYLRIQEEYDNKMRAETQQAYDRFRTEKGARIPTSAIFRGEADVPRSLSPAKKAPTPQLPTPKPRPTSTASPTKPRVQAVSKVAAYINSSKPSTPGTTQRSSPASAMIAARAKAPVRGKAQADPAKIDWVALGKKLPTELTEISKKKRAEIFKQMDVNGNGYLSLAEVDKGIKGVLASDALFDCKPAIIRAFQAAKEMGGGNPDYIEKSEFRSLLCYLRIYLELFHMFDTIDVDNDRRVDLVEFKAALEKVKRWGLNVEDPEAEFASIDVNGGGQVLFNEMADWALKRKLDLEDDDNAAYDLPGPSSALKTGPARKAGSPPAKKSALKQPAASKTTVDWPTLSAKLPSGTDEESKQKRKALFSQFDFNGNGYLSLAEVDKGIKEVLSTGGLFDAKPAILRAFQAAKATVKSKSALGDDYVEANEFRNLLMYLRLYFELFQMFDVIDASDDRRINLDEFKAGLQAIAAWGLNVADPDAEFAAIDTNGGGIILFDEFADWAIRNKLDLEDDDE